MLGLEHGTVLDAHERGDLPIFWPLYGRKGGPLRCWESDLDSLLAERCTTLTGDHEKSPGRPRRGAPGQAPGEVTPDANRILRPVGD